MKILHVISSANPKGGGPIEGIRQLAPRMRELGHQVEVLSCDDPNAEWLNSLLPLKIHPLGPSVLNYAFGPKARGWLKKNYHDYDVVIVNGLWQYSGLLVKSVLAGGRVPYFVFPHGMLDPWFKRNYPIKHLKKLVYWFLIERQVLKNASAVFFTCEQERILARESFPLYSVNEYVTSYGTGVPAIADNSDVAAFYKEFPETKDRRNVLFLSRIHEKKGCDLIIEGLAQVIKREPRIHLILAGPGSSPYLDYLKSLAKKYEVESYITWTGMLQGKMKSAAFNVCEVFLLPSHQENFGIAIAEALASSRPVLISRGVNIWQEIHEAGAGFVSDDTVAGVVENLNAWLDLSQADYDAMCAQSKLCFETSFKVENVAKRISKYLTDFLTIRG